MKTMDKIIDIKKLDQNLNYQDRNDLSDAFSMLSQILLSQFKKNGLSIEKIELGEVDFLNYDSYAVNTTEPRISRTKLNGMHRKEKADKMRF